MTRIGFIETTTVVAVTDTPSSFTVEAPTDAQRSYVLVANIVVHVARNADASTDAMRIPADTQVSISAIGGDTLSFVRGDGENDGSVWLTMHG